MYSNANRQPWPRGSDFWRRVGGREGTFIKKTKKKHDMIIRVREVGKIQAIFTS